MQCPSCGLQIDQQNIDRCPRCGHWLTAPPGYSAQGSYPTTDYGNAPQSGTPGYPPQSGSVGTPGTYEGYTQPSGYGPPSQNPQGQYGSYAPPSGYGQPAPPSGYGQPYGQAAPPSYPLTQGNAPYGYPQQPYSPPPKKRRVGMIIGIVAAAVVVVLVACAGVTLVALRSLGDTTNTTATGPNAAASPTSSGTVIYSDTFASDATGWVQTAGECTLQSDGYHIASLYICYAPVGEQTDVTVSVNVQQVSGPTTHPYGIVFRRVSVGNYYVFRIDSNGEWIFNKCVDSNCTRIVDFTTNAAIKGGLHTSNTLKVTTKGSHFDFFVNDTKVGQSDDSTFTSGKVGLVGGESIDCAFKNIVIARPN